MVTMKCECSGIIAGVLFAIGALTSGAHAAGGDTLHDSDQACYSSYHLKQQLDLKLRFGDIRKRKKINRDAIIHVREVMVSETDRKAIAGNNNRDTGTLRAFLFLVRPLEQPASDATKDSVQGELNPFLVLIDNDNGGLIKLETTSTDPAVIKQYRSTYDLFQYSQRRGNYLYKNGNGQYLARIDAIPESPGSMKRINSGYIDARGKPDKMTRVINSEMEIEQPASSGECFYYKSHGRDHIVTKLSDQAWVEGDARMTLVADASARLARSNEFFKLSNKIVRWPSQQRKHEIPLTKKFGLQNLLALFPLLEDTLSDKDQFIALLLEQRASWPFLADYLQQHSLSDNLSKRLFWALNKINSQQSVDALVQLSTSTLSRRDAFRAVMALGSTNAPMSDASLALLKSHAANYSDPAFIEQNGLVYLRILGAVANRRNQNAPLQSLDLKQFIYQQIGSSDHSTRAAMIDAIGNLGPAIDHEGQDILLAELSNNEPIMRRSAAAAFQRIPYNADNTGQIIRQLSTESDPATQNALISVLGKSPASDDRVKQQLLSLAQQPGLKRSSLTSLKKIKFNYHAEEIMQLENQLRQEHDLASQRLLASLILKQRRQPAQ